MASSTRTSSSTNRTLMLGSGRNWQADDEGRALAFAGFESDRAAVLVDHDRVGDRQALAGAFAHFFGGEERLEHARAHRLWDADAVVRHPHFDVEPDRFGRDHDLAFVGRA